MSKINFENIFKKRNDSVNYTLLIMICLSVIILWVADKGSLETLFSGLAMAGVIFTITLQKKELELQRKELRDTRGEFKIQNETLKKQRFENTFFHLLNLHNDIIDKLYFKKRSQQYIDFNANVKDERIDEEASKRRVFRVVLDYYKIYLHQRTKEDQEIITYEFCSDVKILEKTIKETFIEVFEDFEYVLANYFRTLYHCFRYIYFTDLISKEEKRFYASMVRAQLSSEELELLFYNSLVENLGKPNFTFLMKEYDILQNIYLPNIHQFYGDLYDNVVSQIEDPFKLERA